VSVAGGWGQLAGHAPLSNQYGMGADQFVEFKVVTADGKLKVANKVANPDLFWALRGGGGGTFGIVVEATVKAHLHVPITAYAWWINSTDSVLSGALSAVGSNLLGSLGGLVTSKGIEAVTKASAELAKALPDIGDAGNSAYIYKLPNAIRGVALSIGKNATKEHAVSTWKPVLERMAKIPNMKAYQGKIFQFDNYQHFFDVSYGKEGACMPGMRKRGLQCVARKISHLL